MLDIKCLNLIIFILFDICVFIVSSDEFLSVLHGRSDHDLWTLATNI